MKKSSLNVDVEFDQYPEPILTVWGNPMRFKLANRRMFPHLMRLMYGTRIHGAYVVDKISLIYD